MIEDETDGDRISRRHALALLGTGVAAFTSGSELLRVSGATSDSSETTPSTVGDPTDREPTGDENDDDQEQQEPPGESIEDHGAVSNPDDRTTATAERNLTALLDAARAAGKDGTVFVPEGTYHIGHDGSGPDPFVQFGDREPPGISIVGAGPETAALVISGETPAEKQPNQSGLMWQDGYDHGTITVENVRLHGNYDALPNLVDAGGGSWGLQLDGIGKLELENAYISGWHLAGIRGRHMVDTVRRCTFEDNGIGVHNDANGNANSHHISVRPRDGSPCRIEHCRFIDCAGNAVNVRRNDGTLEMVDCHATGTGSGLCKLSGGGLVVFRRIYHEAHTDSLERKVAERDGGSNFYGRNCINSLGERGDTAVTLRTEHVETRNITEWALQSRGELGDGPPTVHWEGDMVAIHNANTTNGEVAIRNRAGGSFEDVSVERLSVHDSAGDVFSTTRSNGEIELLHRGNNGGGLGNPGDITIETDGEGEQPFAPDVPDAGDVGINTT